MLALFVPPWKMPKPKLRGKFFVKEVCEKERMCLTTLLLYTINPMNFCKVFAKIRVR